MIWMLLKNRKWTLLAIALIIPVGFYTKFYTGPLAAWVNNSLGGILYVIFWSCVVFLFFLKTNPVKITLIVFLATCAVEFLQLWHPAFLENIRGYFLGRTLLGQSFSWWDSVHCAFGFFISLALLEILNIAATNNTLEKDLINK